MTSYNGFNIYFIILFATYKRCNFRVGMARGLGRLTDVDRDTWRSKSISEVTVHQTCRQRKQKKEMCLVAKLEVQKFTSMS